MEVDCLRDLLRQGAGLFAVEGQALAEEHVLQAHAAQADRAPAQVAAAGGLDRVEVQVDHPVQLAHGQAHGLGQAVEVERPVGVHVVGQVDRTQVAHRRLRGRGDLQDLGAQVGQVDDVAGLCGLVAGAVALVLEGHPAVAGLGQGAHHPRVQLARRDRAHRLALGFGLAVGGLERLAVQVGQLRHRVRVEQRPVLAGLHAGHEQVGDPVGQVEVVGAAGVVAGVVAQLQEVLDVGVPGLQVHAGRALALAALVDCGDRGVERPQPRHDAIGMPVGGADQRAARAHPGPAHPDAAAELGQLGDVAVAGVDRLQRVGRRVQQEARGQLLVGGAGVEQGGRGGQVVELAHAPVQRQRFGHVLAERGGDAQEELLRGLDHLAAVRVAQQVAVIQRAQAEVVEAPVQRRVDGVVELARIGLHELQQALVDQAELMAAGHGLREGVDPLAGHLLVDHPGQQPRRQPAVLGFLAGEQGGGADRQLVQLGGGGTVVQAGNGAGGHAHRVHRVQSGAAALDRADDLVEVDRLARAVALGHAHGRLAGRGGEVEAGRHRSGAGCGLGRCVVGDGNAGVGILGRGVLVEKLGTHGGWLRCGAHGSPSLPRGRRTGATHRRPAAMRQPRHGHAPAGTDHREEEPGATAAPMQGRPQHRPSSPEDPGPVTTRRASRGCRQVFGLRTRSTTLHLLPSLPGADAPVP